MSDDSGSGRARGRGGRGRGKPQQTPAPGQQQQQHPPRGGVAGAAPPVGRGRAGGPPRQAPPSEPAIQRVPAVPPTHPQAAIAPTPATEVPASGRGVHRGGGRERPPAGDVPTGAMGHLSVQERQYTRRNPYERYVDIKYKDDGKNTRGETGDRVEVITNYFNVSLPSEFKIYQYHVDFKPEVENIRVKYALISGLDIITGAVKCFDGGILYLCKYLPNEVTECYGTRSYDGAVIKIEIKRICEVFSSDPQYTQIVNILFKKVLVALEMKQIRDHYFNPALSVKLQKHKMEVMPGFDTSILKYEAGNLLGIDIIHKILRIDTFLDGLYNLYHSMEQGNRAAFHAVAMKQFVGTIVMTRYNNKTYRVDDIDWNGRPSHTFEKGGDKITYKDYFKKRWNIDVHDDNQPLLVTRPTERDRRRGDNKNLYLLPELCTITGLSDDVRADFNVMRDLAVHTRIGPDRRLVVLEEFLQQINSNPKVREILAPWHTRFEPRALHVPARQLPAEELLMKTSQGDDTGKVTYNIKEADWSRNMRDMRLLNPVNLINWLMIIPPRLSGPANDLAECLCRVGSGMGMRINDPTRIELPNDRNDSYIQAIRQHLNPRIQIVVVIAPNNKKDRYDAVKKTCCIDNPVPSQVVLQRTLGKKQGLMSIATKIAIQMNCKMGGDVWGITIPIKGLMVFGIDSYHDSAHKDQAVGAVVASLNKQCTRYYSRAEYHPRKNDHLDNLTPLVTAAMRKYHEVNETLPEKLVFYRDGVGDGQLEFVFKHECEQVFNALKELRSERRPAVSYIIVKKRVNTRIFARERNQVINPQPGTIVDSHITKPDWYDFFLISQSVRQGTVSPTSYNVIYDQSGLKADHMQRLTYKLTHLYFNWQGTIRVPAPCQYAHKLAFLQGQSLHREFSLHLADKLFYL